MNLKQIMKTLEESQVIRREKEGHDREHILSVMHDALLDLEEASLAKALDWCKRNRKWPHAYYQDQGDGYSEELTWCWFAAQDGETWGRNRGSEEVLPPSIGKYLKGESLYHDSCRDYSSLEDALCDLAQALEQMWNSSAWED